MSRKFLTIIDSHSHWGPSVSLQTNVSTGEILRQQEETGVTHVVLIPFPSTAIMSNEINIRLLNETKRVEHFIPYCYIREDFSFIPDEYRGGKWHWMRGVQDSSSNYKVLNDPDLPCLIEELTQAGKPIVFEEELDFTERFVEMAPEIRLIIPHLGLLGGNPIDFLSAFKDKPNVYFDTALADRSAILKFVKTVGAERVLFGSDIPFGNMRSELSKVVGLDVPDAEKELILSGNVIRLAKLTL
jgi:predicted TIM-barrel fold metal-dependent hydrolase